MRIKAVLRDSDILEMQPGSKERILATAKKNLDRLVNTGSLLKVMGLPANGRLVLLEILESAELHIWLAIDSDQHVILISDSESVDLDGYKWQ
jgi:hypothetical protein